MSLTRGDFDSESIVLKVKTFDSPELFNLLSETGPGSEPISQNLTLMTDHYFVSLQHFSKQLLGQVCEKKGGCFVSLRFL